MSFLFLLDFSKHAQGAVESSWNIQPFLLQSVLCVVSVIANTEGRPSMLRRSWISLTLLARWMGKWFLHKKGSQAPNQLSYFKNMQTPTL